MHTSRAAAARHFRGAPAASVQGSDPLRQPRFTCNLPALTGPHLLCNKNLSRNFHCRNRTFCPCRVGASCLGTSCAVRDAPTFDLDKLCLGFFTLRARLSVMPKCCRVLSSEQLLCIFIFRWPDGSASCLSDGM